MSWYSDCVGQRLEPADAGNSSLTGDLFPAGPTCSENFWSSLPHTLVINVEICWMLAVFSYSARPTSSVEYNNKAVSSRHWHC